MKYKIEPETLSYITLEDLKNNCRVLIGLPVYNGSMESEMVKPLLSLTKMAVTHHIDIDYFFITQEALIPRGRNKIVRHFLSSPKNYTHLMFIDADVKFNEVDFFKILYYNMDIVTAALPKKLHPINFAIEILLKENKEKTGSRMVATLDKRLVELKRCSLAFFLAKRRVFEEMKKAFPELKSDACEMESQISIPIKNMGLSKNKEEQYRKSFDNNFYSFFDDGACRELIIPDLNEKDIEKNSYLSECIVFTERWRSIGGRIWLDPRVKLGHIGKYSYEGDCMSLFPKDFQLPEDHL